MKKIPIQSLDGLDQIRILDPLNRLTAISLITHNRVPQILKMDSYLMSSSGVRKDAKVGEVSIVTDRLIAGQGLAGTSTASRDFGTDEGIPPQGDIDDTSRFFETPIDQRQVALLTCRALN